MTRRDAGFTMMEVLAALTVFLIGVAGVLSLLTSGTHLHQSSQNTSGLADTVEEVLWLAERELSISPVSDETGLPEPRLTTGVPGNDRYSYSWRVKAGEVSPPYLLEVTIEWREGGKTQTHVSEMVVPDLKTMSSRVRRLKASRD